MQSTNDMERKQITCPETAHLEEVDLERTRHGLLVIGCSRFQPRCELQCPRECARRLDRRDARDVDDREERVLIIYADAKRTRPICRALAARLALDGMTVEQADAELGAPPPADYDAVVIGMPVRFGRYPRSLLAYAAEHVETLTRMPTFLYAVQRTDAVDVTRFARATGLHPTHAIGIPWQPWHQRWFADPIEPGNSRVRELAEVISDEVSAVERE